MIDALFFLIRKSWVNRLKMRLRRLKQPKYLVGAIFGGLYFVYIFGIRFMASGAYPGRGGKVMVTPGNAQMFESLGALIFFVFILLAWVLPRERAALIFSEAEVAFLFPAPVSRRSLIHYKLVKSQVAVLFTVLFLTLFFGRFWTGGMAWLRAVGWWVMLSTLNLHILAASFARTMLLEHGISNWKRRAVVLALVVAAAAGVFLWAKQTIPPPDVESIRKASDAKYYFEKVTGSGPLPYLLYPFRIVVRPYIEAATGTVWTFLGALCPALLLMTAHYWWVMRANVAFEEASVEASRRAAERIATMRANRGQWAPKPTKKKRAPFKLSPTGQPAVALLWKNLIGAGSAFTWRFWFLIACMMVPIGTVLATTRSTQAFAEAMGPMAVMLLAMSFLIGPQILRQDFRNDLPMADVLKTYPLRGWQVAMGELLAPAAILTGVQWILVILAAAVMSRLGRDGIPLDWRLAGAFGAAVIALPLNVVSLLIPNASVLLFPGWFQTGKEGPQGVEVTGQRLIFAIGAAVVFAVAMLPAAVVAAAIYFLAQMAIGPVWPVPLASLGAAATLAVEAGFGVVMLGKLFDNYDVAERAM